MSVTLTEQKALRVLRGGDPQLESRIMQADLSEDLALATSLRAAWWRGHGMRARQRVPMNDDKAERQLRVGYVSGNFNFHSACTVFAPVVLGHSASIQPYCYSSSRPESHDEVTEAFRRETHWRDVYEWSDAALADLILRDEIDVLVDLSGFTPWNRLPVFAMRPAPVQVHGWGYAYPTTFPCFDAFFADPVALPVEWRAGAERVVDLPCILAQADRRMFAEAGELPCLSRAPVFGCFNRPEKVNERSLALWKRVLDAVPGSSLVLKFGGFTAQFQAHAMRVLGGRVRFPGATEMMQHVAAYDGIDLALDPLAQSGGVSSLEALWMGVPVVTLPRRNIGTRTSASALTVLGLRDEFVAASEDDYVQKAATWVTTRRQELAALRAGLRERMRASPLCAGYVDAVEAAYRMLWNEWCQA